MYSAVNMVCELLLTAKWTIFQQCHGNTSYIFMRFSWCLLHTSLGQHTELEFYSSMTLLTALCVLIRTVCLEQKQQYKLYSFWFDSTGDWTRDLPYSKQVFNHFTTVVVFSKYRTTNIVERILLYNTLNLFIEPILNTIYNKIYKIKHLIYNKTQF